MKGILTLLLVLVVVFNSAAQLRKKAQTLKVRHIQGVKSFEIGGGISGYGVFGNAYFSEFFRNNVYWKGGVGYEYAKGKGETNYTSVYGDLLLGYTVVDKGALFINAIGGVTLGFDKLTGLSTTKKESALVYGPVVGAEFEWYLVNNVVLIITGTQRIIIPKEFDDRWYLGAGFRFKL